MVFKGYWNYCLKKNGGKELRPNGFFIDRFLTWG